MKDSNILTANSDSPRQTVIQYVLTAAKRSRDQECDELKCVIFVCQSNGSKSKAVEVSLYCYLSDFIVPSYAVKTSWRKAFPVKKSKLSQGDLSRFSPLGEDIGNSDYRVGCLVKAVCIGGWGLSNL